MIKDDVEEWNQKIQSAIEEYKPYREKYERIINTYNYKKNELVVKVIRYLNSEIEESHSCSCCRPRFYDEGWITEKGITLRKDADHPHDIVDKKFTWEQIEHILGGNE